MEPLSEWHAFDANDPSTYPKVRARIQVRHKDGLRSEGDFLHLLSEAKKLRKSPLEGWRYVDEKETK